LGGHADDRVGRRRGSWGQVLALSTSGTNVGSSNANAEAVAREFQILQVIEHMLTC
jgi:hypothetical protein